MALHLHRSNRVEALVDMLCAELSGSWPVDPFERVPIVVGSAGMERYLRHEIATRIGIASGLAFPFPRPALAGAANWLLSDVVDRQADFWELDDEQQKNAMRFGREYMALGLIPVLRSHAGRSEFDRISHYLGEGRSTDVSSESVSARELMFARDVADVVDRLMHDRPLDALSWARDPSLVDPSHRWLAILLQNLGAASDDLSPAARFETLCAKDLPITRRVLCVFGLSTLGPGERERLAAIAKGIDVHLFVLAPTREWFVDQPTRGEARRAVRAADTLDQLSQIESDRGHANPIVAALGAPSRDLQNWFEESGYQHDEQLFESSLRAEPTLLHRIHDWMLAAEGIAHVTTPWSLDASVQFHSTYGALRQCEVLRDQLLTLFAADATLEPRDVLVMTPDIETYASLVAAVFARRGGTLPAIATSIADLGLSRTNAMAEVMLALLELATERVTATRVSSLLSLSPVRARFGIDDDDLGALQQLLRDSGLRWGMDADDRARVEQPRRDQNTLRFAAERVALGVLMPDEQPLSVVRGDNHDLQPAVPLDAQGSAATGHAGRLLALLHAIRVHRPALAGPLPVTEWRARLLHALDAIAQAPEESAWLRAEVVDALDALVEQAEALGELTLERDALRKWLTGGFEIAQRGDRPITGAVTVCALQPMRSVPFRVVALVGLDDGAFPRGSRARSWDPFEQRRSGERDGREIDRHLLLEGMLSAREHLIFLWSGHDVQSGKDQAAAVPVEELLETIAAVTGQERHQLVREHPLQPWSERAFLPRPTSHDAALARAATLRRDLRAGIQPPTEVGLFGCRTSLLPAESNPPRDVSIADLVNALYKPQKHFLRARLGLWLQTDRITIEDREPLELDKLESDHKITDRVLDGLRDVAAGVEDAAVVEMLAARLAGTGELPLRAGGRKVLSVHQRCARAVLNHAEAVLGVRRAPLDLAWQSESGLTLSGHVADVRDHEGSLLLQWTNAWGESNSFALLNGWMHLLVARAAGHPVVGARVVGDSAVGQDKRAVGSFLLAPSSAESARDMLEDLVRIFRRARRIGLPLFKGASAVAAKALLAQASGKRTLGAEVRLQGELTAAWEGRQAGSSGDSDDPWVAALFGDYTPADDLSAQSEGFLDLARRVWLPVFEASKAGAELATRFKPADGGDLTAEEGDSE